MSQHSASTRQPGSGSRPPLRARLLALVVRPTAPPLWLGIVVAVVFITGETLLVYRLQEIAPENAFGALFLLGVLVVSAGWEFRLAVATSVASAHGLRLLPHGDHRNLHSDARPRTRWRS